MMHEAETRAKERYARFAVDRQEESEFLERVKDHKLTVVKDDGIHRHLVFSRQGSSVYRFELVTFPGFLVYTGDMGSFMFRRLEDMFEFFRTKDVRHLKEVGLTLYTNHSYWSEKLVATDCSGRNAGKATEFDPERFKTSILETLHEWIRDARREKILSKDERRDLWDSVHSEVLDKVDNYGDSSQTLAYDFSWKPCRSFNQTLSRRAPRYQFDDLFERNFERYTHTFRWCCLALSWGIIQYDAWKDAKKKEQEKKDAFDSLPDDYEVN